MRRIAFALLLAAAHPAAADVSIGIEATLGAQRLGVQRFPGTSRDLSPLADVGGATLLLRSGPLMLGLAAERNRDRTGLPDYDASALAGLAGDLLPMLRLELLGELGVARARSVADLRSDATARVWDSFYGVRPGLSAKLPAFPLRVGVWGLVRWGLPGQSGAPELGLLGRVGLEL